MATIRQLFLALIVFFALAPLSQSSAALTYNNGVYTNICGTGTLATANSCNKGCDPATGTCSSSMAGVVKYVCDGRTDECKSNESSFSTTQSFAGATCGKTYQLDVFNKSCRSGGNWTCTEGNLQDYMVWYSGDCAPTPICQDVTITDASGSNFTWAQNTTHNWYGSSKDPLTNVTTRVTGGLDSTNQQNPFITGTYNWNYTSTVGTNPGTYTLTFRGYKGTTLCSTSRTISVPALTPTPNPTNSPIPTPTSIAQQSSCEDLSIISGNNTTVPTTVSFRVRGSDNKGSIQRYRYFYGDSRTDESDSPDMSHRYETSGTFTARAEIKDSQGYWKSSSACEKTITVNPVSLESHRSDCSNVYIEEGQNSQAPASVKIRVSGYDNKGNIQKYRVDFGNGNFREDYSDTFRYTYNNTGTYTIKGYMWDSEGVQKGGTGSCQQTLYVNTVPLTKQPNTGAPTTLALTALISGAIGATSLLLRKRLA